jgi:hypothetical protein
MNARIVLVLFICLLSGNRILAQISYGGTPLFLDSSSLKSSAFLVRSNRLGLIDMPAFDVDSVLRANARNEGSMRGSYPFAYKFFTHIERGQDGNEWMLADGTLVWQVAIRSQGAYSINLLFTEYHVPEGAKLFLYNADHSYILGSYDHRNNSPSGLLPVQPVAGETIIVEYSEPADAAFRGKLTIGDVNHDYRDILRGEPGSDLTTGEFVCMPDVVCQEVDETTVRSTLLVMVDGTVACTGTLVNNTSDDGVPYVLTAVHCLNDDMAHGIPSHKDWEYYVSKAGTVVVFFNYSRPVCGHSMKATEEFALAEAYPRTVIEGKDIALLEMHDKPPAHYNAYYAGWDLNFDAKPYTNIHHPHSAVKRYNFYNGNLTWTSFYEKIFDLNSHLQVAAWTTGSTHVGSSGSPLFDAKHALIGGLSGGFSTCGTRGADSFFPLIRGWETSNPDNQLKTYLDPGNTGKQSIAGMDPNRQQPLLRLGNVPYNNGYNLITTQYSGSNSGYVFGNSNLNVNEFAEEFTPEYEAELYGVYLLIPPMPVSNASGVEIRVYEGADAPEQLIATQNLKPQFLDYSGSAFGLKDKYTSYVATENFVRFDQPVKISTKFFISYHINNAPGSQFAVYNTQSSAGAARISTAWINQDGTWTRSAAYSTRSVSTSLAIEALLSYTNIPVPPGKTARIGYIRSLRRLILPNTSEASGQAVIYTASGQLIERIPVPDAAETIDLRRPQPGGTIGIVRVVRGNETYIGKLIY